MLLKKEKEKKDNLQRAVQEKEMEDQYNIKVRSAEDQIDKIKELAQKQVYVRRNKLKNKLLKMRKMSERKQADLQQKLKDVKLSMAQEMTNMYKLGDQNKCIQKDDKGREAYCSNNFVDNYNKYDLCKSEDNFFCYVCCENEFGEMQMKRRESCVKNLCEKEDTEEGDASGNWVWMSY